jgi:hypothetical protein
MGGPKPVLRSDSKEDLSVSFSRAQLEELCKQAADAAVKVANDAFSKRLQSMEKALQQQRDRTAALEAELEAARKAHLSVLADHNRLEQYSRRAHLRISGLPLKDGDDAKQVVADFLSDKLRTTKNGRISVTRADLDAAHKLPARPLTEVERAEGKEERIPMVIVRFHSRELRDMVMMSRRSLKNTGCSLQDDLTKRNYQLLQSLKRCPKLDSVWTWNGKLFGKLKGKERGDVYDIFDPLPL